MLDVHALHADAPVIALETVDSTQNVVAEMGREGAKHLTCVVAERQEAGRGRRGKTWFTFPDVSLAASILVRDEGALDVLPLLASIAFCKAVHQVSGAACKIRWPNDLHIDGRKFAGILVEKVAHEPAPFYVLGVGVNVNTPDGGLPENVVGTTLEAATGTALSREAVLDAMLTHLHQTLSHVAHTGWVGLKDEYERLCDTLGREVEWYGEEGSIVGRAVAISETGALHIQTPSGVKKVTSGMIVRQGKYFT